LYPFQHPLQIKKCLNQKCKCVGVDFRLCSIGSKWKFSLNEVRYYSYRNVGILPTKEKQDLFDMEVSYGLGD